MLVVGATTWAMSFAQQACHLAARRTHPRHPARNPSTSPATPRTPPAAPCTQPAPSLHARPPQAFSASTAALAYAMEPLFAALFAAAILHESIHELQLLGGALVVRPLATPAPTRSRNPTPTLRGGGGRSHGARPPA